MVIKTTPWFFLIFPFTLKGDFLNCLRRKSHRNLKGQMKIQQMIFMILAVFLLFVLVGIFFLSISLSNLKETATELEEKNALLLVSKLANSPELSCGEVFGTSRTNCIDFDKVMAINLESYSDFWGLAKVEIRKIYPDQGNVLCNNDNYPNCGVVKLVDREVDTSTYSSSFVSLCRKDTTEKIMYDKCELALLMVSSEYKGG